LANGEMYEIHYNNGKKGEIKNIDNKWF
jgi:hypothetical protein